MPRSFDIRRSAQKECEQVGVHLILVGGREAMRGARMVDILRAPDEPCRLPRAGGVTRLPGPDPRRTPGYRRERTRDADWQIFARDARMRRIAGRVRIRLAGPTATDGDIVRLETTLFDRLADAIEIPENAPSASHGSVARIRAPPSE